MADFENNVHNVALIFEGGGMRASYTAAFANVLLENGIYFNDVYGVSAGSSNSVNYISRDQWRVRESFTGLAGDPKFGGIGTFLTGKGMFSAQYIYQETGKPDGVLPFQFEKLHQNPAHLTIEGFERDTGKTLYWTKRDMPQLNDLMIRVQASSSLPLVMPVVMIEGRAYYDGGLGEGSGIMLPRAQADGFEKFVVVCTRPRGYRKSEKQNALINSFFWRRPAVQQALATRAARYNAQLDELGALEKEGRAFVFYAEGQEVESSERDVATLNANYERGYVQAQSELAKLEDFLQASARR